MFQSTRPVWGATNPFCIDDLTDSVSIHAPRVGRDTSAEETGFSISSFNPRAPCGARRDQLLKWLNDYTFQSTRPVWGATDVF